MAIPDEMLNPISVFLGGVMWDRAEAPPFDAVWKKIYHPSKGISIWAISQDAFGWWYLSQRRKTRTPADIGPFDSKEAAAACFNVMTGFSLQK